MHGRKSECRAALISSCAIRDFVLNRDMFIASMVLADGAAREKAGESRRQISAAHFELRPELEIADDSERICLPST